MKDLNRMVLIGRLGANPIMRETKSQKKVANFSVATDYTIRSKEEVEKRTTWHKIVTWGKMAENCNRFLKKGHLVYVEGPLLNRSYQTEEGHDQNVFEVNADEVRFLTPPKSQSQEEIAS